ncbi:MAG: sensor domain-containing diguanylate cyclase [Elusimicrobiaceae bacterium]|nr:sensor domain-containing diguanylate cyclase [Elusimicrobiaceae bacterium]
MLEQSTQVLYEFYKELNHPVDSPGELLSLGLDIIARYMKLDQVFYFEWEPKSSVLSLGMVWRDGHSMELEEDIYVPDNAPLLSVLTLGGVHVSQDLNYPAMYVPLRWQQADQYAAGGKQRTMRYAALRLERLKKSWAFSTREKELARGLAEELAHSLMLAELDYMHRSQVRRLTALTNLNAVFASTMRSGENMKFILQGIQKYFGFDRVRLYLVNSKDQKLKGELSTDIHGQVRSLSHEEIPLLPGTHRFADIVLGPDSTVVDKYRDTVLHLPLTVQGKRVGLLVVDNLVSQQRIEPDDIVSLSSFAGQIGLAIDNAMLFEEVQDLSQYDDLTGLPLRRYFNQRFQDEMYRAERFSQPMAIIWIDIDFFKDVNDTYGHQVGDKVLKEVSRVILSNLRKIDFPGRYGGDEIQIMLPQATATEAKAIARRLDEEVREIRIPVPFSKEGDIGVTISQGISTYPGDAASGDELLKKADDALYWVKSHGRGGYVLYSDVKDEL